MFSLSCIQTSVKGDSHYDLFHPCRGGVAKIFVAMNDTSGLGFCYELNGSLFSSLYSGACSRRTRSHDILIQVETITSLASLFRVKNVQVVSQIIHWYKIIIIIEQIKSVNR